MGWTEAGVQTATPRKLILHSSASPNTSHHRCCARAVYVDFNDILVQMWTSSLRVHGVKTSGLFVGLDDFEVAHVRVCPLGASRQHIELHEPGFINFFVVFERDAPNSWDLRFFTVGVVPRNPRTVEPTRDELVRRVIVLDPFMH